MKILADELATAQGNLILEFTARPDGRLIQIEIILDTLEGGVTIDQCAQLNKQFCRAVDEELLINGDYTVQVASPGLDRQLHQPYEFRKRLGKEVRIHLDTAVEGKKEYQGLIRAVTDDRIEIEVKTGIIVIPLTAVHFGKQII